LKHDFNLYLENIFCTWACHVCEVRMNKSFRKLSFNQLTYEVCCTDGYIDIKSLKRNKRVSTDFTVMFWFRVTQF